MTAWNWNGARWWKFDFHTHTPASEDYGNGPNQAELKMITPAEWLIGYMRAGVDCVAVTDHNTGAWIDRLQSALLALRETRPAGFREIVLFPGVEISANGGVHLLAILGPSAKTSEIDALLGAVRFRGDQGKSDAETEASFHDVVEAIRSAGGIAVPAHADKAKGLLTQAVGTTLSQALDCDGLFAMEVVEPGSAKPTLYSDRKLGWAEIVGSDSHHPAGSHGQRYAGSHFTWVKMAAPSFEGLRLALLDGELSIRRSDASALDPNTHSPLVIESIEISQARYMGRARPFEIRLNPWLNAIIGGRGTGKSTAVEFLRFTLQRVAERPRALTTEFEKYGKAYASRDEDGLLTRDSHFTVVYRKDRTRFRVQWTLAGSLDPIQVADAEGVWKLDQGDVAQRFPVRIYSQKQIFELARAPLALLRIVDEAPEVDKRTWDGRWREEETKFLSLRAKEREIEAGLSDEPRLKGELEDVLRRLAIFEEAGHAGVLKEYQNRLRQREDLDRADEVWAGQGKRIREVAAELVEVTLDTSGFSADRTEDRDLLASASTFAEVLLDAKRSLERVAESIESAHSGWREDRKASSWTGALNEAVTEYEKLSATLAAGGVEDPSAYGELVKRRQALEARLKELHTQRGQLESMRTESMRALERLQSLRQELTASRAAFLGNVLRDNPYVKIEVIRCGAKESVEPEFRRLVQRDDGGFDKDIGAVGGDGLLGSLYRGGADATSIEKEFVALSRKVRDIATAGQATAEIKDARFAAHVARLPAEALDRLDSWSPEDSLDVQYSTAGDGSGLRSIQEGSPGQKTAALLAFLLSYGQEPIILDQPEDDLDNHLVYDLIVAQLRRLKTKRQVIVVTHNANVVVNGDAELVIALAARGGETQIDCAGSLQEGAVREKICAVLEGGREAFERRYRRIALDGRRR